MVSFFNFIALVVIAYLVYRIFRHFVPPTPPAAAGTTPTPTTPFNWSKVWKVLGFIAAVAGIFFLFSLACAMLKNGGIGSGRGDSSSQSVDVRDNYGVIQQNDVHVTNNKVTVQTVEKVRTVYVADDDVIVKSGSERSRLKTIKKKYTDSNEDPGISVNYEKDAPTSGTSLR
jgi:hypothetical protein